MVNSHLGHDAQMHNDCTLTNGALVGGHVELGDFAVLGGNAAVHQFCRIGRLSMIAGLHGVTQDLPPFCIVHRSRRVGSLNLIGLRRAGYRRHIEPLRQAFDLLYRHKLTNLAAAEQIAEELKDDPLCVEFAALFARPSAVSHPTVRSILSSLRPKSQSDVGVLA